jgi:hypothetical protein
MHEKEKLKEAQFFLDRMKENVDNTEDFKFNLSAFLSASRSVLYYALEEVKNTSHQNWHDSKISGSTIFKYFKDKRDISVHIKPIRPGRNINIVINETINISAAVSVSLQVTDNNGNVVSESKSVEDNQVKKEKPRKEKTKGATVQIEYIFSDWVGTENVIILSEKYLSELEQFVDEGIRLGYLTEEL